MRSSGFLFWNNCNGFQNFSSTEQADCFSALWRGLSIKAFLKQNKKILQNFVILSYLDVATNWHTKILLMKYLWKERIVLKILLQFLIKKKKKIIVEAYLPMA